MIRQNKKMILFTSVITLLPIFIGMFLWNQLPDSIATHFGVNNQPDGYSSKAFAVFGLQLILLAVHLVVWSQQTLIPNQKSGCCSRCHLWICDRPGLAVNWSDRFNWRI